MFRGIHYYHLKNLGATSFNHSSRIWVTPLTYVFFVTKSSVYTTQDGGGFRMNNDEVGWMETSVPPTFVLYLPRVEDEVAPVCISFRIVLLISTELLTRAAA
mmetsp:Transcript_23185/g.33918  ORF Transcript_23185/g.33918 Transcript_23185/m.33918 type:complete len:102 (+) Transcript_23185:165-470(+)